jgi:SSS family transporter
MQGQGLIFTIICVYCVGMLVLGVYLSKSVKNTGDFLLAGRTLGPWVTAISYGATYFSSVAMIGSVATVYMQGIGYGIWLAMGCSWLFSIGAFVLVAIPIRRMSGRLNCVTIPELYGKRFGSKKITFVTALLTATFLIPLIASIFKAVGDTLSVVAGMEYVPAVLLTAAVVMIYVWASGYYGVAVTDVIQGIMMFIGVLILSPVVLYRIGGMTEVVSKLKSIDPNLVNIPGNYGWGMFLSLALVWGLTCWGQPHLLIRFVGIKSEKDIGKMALVGTIFATLFIAFSYLSGPLARAMYGNEFIANPDVTVPEMIVRNLTPFLGGVFVAALAAGAMSSLDSLALVAASSVSKDIYGDCILKGERNEKRELLISRITAVGVILASLIFALKPPDIIFMLSLYTAGVLGAALGPALFFILFWRRANWQGCLASILGGTIGTLIGFWVGVKVVHPYVIGAIFAVILFPLVTLMTPEPDKDLVKRVFGN